MTLDHAKLDVYRFALDLLDVIDHIVESLPPGRAHLKDQIDRATTSVVLNIAEGAGEFSRADKHRFYRMAKRSAVETAAILDILERRAQGSPSQREAARALIVSIVSMLTKMALR